VYFGNITELNDKYLTITDIYYLRANGAAENLQSTSGTKPTDVSLAKLGCELHGPQDKMVIQLDQVNFWENLKKDGVVVKAIDTYVKANPNGQKCV
jgi:hypothetical protein